jgi:hypothetical protein
MNVGQVTYKVMDFHLLACFFKEFAYLGGTHMIVKTLGSACLLLEIRWQKGRQADRMCTCTHSLPTFLLGPSNFLSLP